MRAGWKANFDITQGELEPKWPQAQLLVIAFGSHGVMERPCQFLQQRLGGMTGRTLEPIPSHEPVPNGPHISPRSRRPVNRTALDRDRRVQARRPTPHLKVGSDIPHPTLPNAKKELTSTLLCCTVVSVSLHGLSLSLFFRTIIPYRICVVLAEQHPSYFVFPTNGDSWRKCQ